MRLSWLVCCLSVVAMALSQEDAALDPVFQLHFAARWGHSAQVATILDLGAAAFDARDAQGLTPMMRAAEGGHTDLVRRFVDLGAQLEARSNDQSTALMLAAHRNHVGVVALLLYAGADRSLVNRAGWNALALAASAGHADVATQLLNLSPPIDFGIASLPLPGGFTPLLLAAHKGHASFVAAVLKFVPSDRVPNRALLLNVAVAQGRAAVARAVLDATPARDRAALLHAVDRSESVV